MAEVSFGEWLKRRRSALGLTQEELARQIHCSTSALRKFESEERHPSAEVVAGLAEIFNIHPEERKSFLRFARGDWQAISGADTEESPWRNPRVAPRSNLPASTTSFIGREKELDEIVHLVAKNRLVTLAGAGGIGKTRLSIQVASTLLNNFPNGIWLVELAPLSDPALVPQAIVNVLGLIEQANRSPQVILTGFLQDKHALLILDNCEHLIQACAELAETLLQACPDLHLLATSREALGIAGEMLYRVPTLTTPDPVNATFSALSNYEAVQLFIERAQSALTGFKLTQENTPAIAQVCHHLDGIPLALELAAARVNLLRVEEIAARLNDRFRLLTGGARTALPRHQTLQALIDWSHDLLTEPERVLLRRLSVFAGGWTLEAAESVCTDLTTSTGSVRRPDPSPERKGEQTPPYILGKGAGGIGPMNILDLLTSLVNKSLVIAERKQGNETRYHMLETIRQYARDKLWEVGEGELMRQQHLVYFVDLAERAEPNLRAFDMVMWLDRLEAELDNIRAALEWAQESDIESELRLASALLWFWQIRGYRNEGIDWLDRGLSIEAMTRGDQPLKPARVMLRAQALYAVASLRVWWREMMAQGTALLKESLALFQELGPAGRRGMAYALWNLGAAAAWQGDYDQGKILTEESLTLFLKMEDKFGVAECLMHLGIFALEKGDFSRAREFWEERLALSRELGDKDGIAHSLSDLGQLASSQGDYQRAIDMHKESVVRWQEIGGRVGVVHQLRYLAFIVHAQSQEQRAVCLLGAAEALCESINSPIMTDLTGAERAEHDQAIATARAALGEEAFAKAWTEGQAMSLDEAVAYALEDKE